jgi:outer membrane murein-binding lipoprotein Lpp
MKATVAALVLLLAGCVSFSPGAGERAKVSEIVAQAVTSARAPAAAQQRTVHLAREAYRRDRTIENRLRLATLLATLPAPLRDDGAAYALLKPFTAERSESPYASFGALLAGQVAERLRLTRESERAAREQERAVREQERAAREAEQREKTLREQLDALKSIERGIVEREERIRRNRR